MLIYRTKGVLELLEKNYRIYASLNSMASLSYCTLVCHNHGLNSLYLLTLALVFFPVIFNFIAISNLYSSLTKFMFPASHWVYRRLVKTLTSRLTF